MAQITMTIPDAVMPDVIDALCDRGHYDPTRTELTRAQFARSMVIDYVRTVTKHYRAEKKANAERQTELAAAEAALTIT